MSDTFKLCKPPALYVCSGADCWCEPRPVIATPLPQPCPLSERLVCTEATCVCEPLPRQPIVDGEPVGPGNAGGCTLLLAVVVAGIKKSLVACWING